MKYFSSFPKINYPDGKGNLITLIDITKRSEIIPSLLTNPLIFYSYDVQDGDTPEIIANKYYGDPYRYWLVLFANQLFDPLWSFPMSSQLFTDYINDKYSSQPSPFSYVQSTITEYRKTITTYDSNTQTTTSKVIVIDQPTYANTIPSSVTATLPSGFQVTKTVSVAPVSIYQLEVENNEAKRTINLINSNYVSQIEAQFVKLMNS